MINWLKKVFCRHSWKHLTGVQWITPTGTEEASLLECTKCKKLQYGPYHEEENVQD
jgi:hypothetical protein